MEQDEEVTLRLSQRDYKKLLGCLYSCWWGYEEDGVRLYNLFQSQTPCDTDDMSISKKRRAEEEAKKLIPVRELHFTAYPMEETTGNLVDHIEGERAIVSTAIKQTSESSQISYICYDIVTYTIHGPYEGLIFPYEQFAQDWRKRNA